MKVFVTGGAGYVGSHCVRLLCDNGIETVIFDNLKSGHEAAADSRATLIQGELADISLLDQTFSGGGFDAVLHFAALLDVAESVRDPLAYYENNVVNTVRLLQLMQRHDIHKFIFSSTCATYGTPPAAPITEDMPQSPINPYGHTKLAMEWALADSAEAWGLGSCALRYFNASGAAADGSIGEDHHPEPHLIPIVLQVAQGKRNKVSIFGTDYPTPDGTAVRDYIHVEDLASAHLLALQALQPGEVRQYNVGTGRGTSVKEIIEACRKVTSHQIPAVHAARRAGDPPELYANPTKIKTALGWQPKYTDIEKNIATAWQWHRTHPNGFGDQ